jgi:gliding motility-associated-like protein
MVQIMDVIRKRLIMKKTFIALFVCIANILSAQNVVVPGRVRVKLKPASNERMIQLSPAMKYAGVSTSAGKAKLLVNLESLDALNQKHKAVSMRRVFPHAGKHEAKQEKFGLHLWYDIETDNKTNPVELAKIYRADSNVELAEPVVKVKYHGRNQEPRFQDSGLLDKGLLDKGLLDKGLLDKGLLDTVKPQAFTPADPDYQKQWHYNNTGQSGGTSGIDVGLKEAWSLTKGHSNVIVAIVDGGVDFNHEDLKDNMWINAAELGGLPNVDDDNNGYVDDVYGFNFVDGYGYNYSQNPIGPAAIIPSNHGTHVAGTVAARTDNAKGGAGVAGGDNANAGVRLMSCQTMVDGADKGAYLYAAIAYAANNGAVILQNSWGFEPEGHESEIALDAIRYFIATAGTDEHGNPLPTTPMLGGLVIFAAGNENSSGRWYPARYDEVLAVSSVNHYGKRAYYSNYGDWVDLAAPGGDTQEKNAGGVYSTLPNNKYGYLQGTSMACPHVSGVAALALSRYGSNTYTPEELRYRLIAGVDTLPTQPLYLGAGLVKASKVVANYVDVAGVSLPPSVNVPLGRTVRLTANIIPETATDKRVVWSVDNASVATVAANGAVEGKTMGTTNVKVRTNDGGFEATILINVVPLSVEGVNIALDETNIIKGRQQQLSAEVSPPDATNKTLSWRSANPSIVTVDANGMASALELGSTLLIVETGDGGFADTCRVAVVKAVEGVRIEQDAVRMLKGNSLTLEAEVLPHDAFDKTVSWRSSNTDVMSVNSSTGRVLAKKTGQAKLIVNTYDGDYEAECEIIVHEAIHAPEGFSPDGDGVNDFFVITMDSRQIYALKVFDRSGQTYYEAEDYKNDWDGTANVGARKGSRLEPGTYFYSLTTKGGSAKKGFVVIRY